nr:iron-containing redox enzyme family protein [Rhodopirellula sp. SM50]
MKCQDAEIVSWLAGRVDELLERMKQEPFWLTVTDPTTPDHVVQAIMREIYLEIVGYQPHVIEAAIASIAQLPRSMKPKMIRSMLYHQADEWDHGEMALRDFVNMGGDETYARNLPMSPPSFAVAGVWWMITQLRDPFAYIDALYLFEGLTPIVTDAVKEGLRAKGMREDQLEYVEFHSTEDLKHARLVNHLIAEVVSSYPEALDSVQRGYEYFEAVYPIPVWRTAYERAMRSDA